MDDRLKKRGCLDLSSPARNEIPEASGPALLSLPRNWPCAIGPVSPTVHLLSLPASETRPINQFGVWDLPWNGVVLRGVPRVAEFLLVPSSLVLALFLDPLMSTLIPRLAVNHTCPFDNRWWRTEPQAWEQGIPSECKPFEGRGPGTLFSRISTHLHSQSL